MELKEFIVETVSKVGTSGFEDNRANFLVEEFKKYCDSVEIDKIGNVVALKKGKGKGKIMFMAHMDEIGLMISDIDENGLLSVVTLGGFDARTLLAQEVKIFGKKEVIGVVAILPPHLTTEENAKKASKIQDIRIDTGMSIEKVKELVSVGDVAVVRRNPVELLNRRLASRCLDDVVGLGCMYETMKGLQDIIHDVDIYFVASTQEETCYLGSTTATRTINPDIGIALDVNFAKTPETTNIHTELGKGPIFEISPKAHRAVLKLFKETANKNSIDYQIVVEKNFSGTDTAMIQVANDGVAACDIGIPLRYMHTSVETVDLNDLDEISRFMICFIKSFNSIENMEEFLCY